jgi:septal ring factor EnvC (AmiA/AmiB activator)
MPGSVKPEDAPPGTVLIKRGDGALVEDERPHHPAGGTALTQALSASAVAASAAATSAADGWKKWREMTAFALVCFLLYSFYRDYVHQSREQANKIEAAVMMLNTAINAQTQQTHTTLQTVANKHDIQLAKADRQYEQIREENRMLRDEMALDRKTLAKLMTDQAKLLTALERKLPAMAPAPQDGP